ncbi:MAG TPA: 4-(cytidine 5'-diphospho)-2-C-methyl-D-erythritol kinase [Gemmatimonadaceae bacterium]|nr:4-(cytidine 5'-diphospho)-2-C-methyl-D-erythritol kinase [Gemmatimonadaceae bacterium]
MTLAAGVSAQAKINLRLRVLARESSGYHSIETIFQRIDLADDVTVRVTSGRTLDCAGPAMPAAGLGATERNLAYRAAAAYVDATGWPTGFAIEIVKRIPVGGGLGGGSADAGAVLRALDALAPRPIGPALVELASPLGADVPFMTVEHATALGWGRGERLMPLPTPPSWPAVLLVPDFSIPTADAYLWVAEERGLYAPAASMLPANATADWQAVARVAANDFQPVVARPHPEIAELVDELRAAGATVAMLAGSGSSVFGVFESAPDVAAIARSAGVSAITTRTSDVVARVVRAELDR